MQKLGIHGQMNLSQSVDPSQQRDARVLEVIDDLCESIQHGIMEVDFVRKINQLTISDEQKESEVDVDYGILSS